MAPAAAGQATLTQTAGKAAKVAVSLSPASIAADGTSTSTATATVTDANGNPVPSDTVAFTSSDTGEKIGTVTANANGTYTATITSSTTAGTPTITATDSSVSPSLTAQATLTQTLGAAAKVAVSLSPASIAADGTSTSTATATVTDAGGNPVADNTVAFTSSDAGEKIGTVTDNANGTYTATITSSKTVHKATITATDSSVSPSLTAQATLTQTTGFGARVTVSLSPGSIVANGSSTSTATASIVDAQGHPVSGDDPRFSSSEAGQKIGKVTDKGNGTYTATITSSTTVHKATITAADSSASPAVSGSATLTQTAGPAASVAVSLSPGSILANGTSTSIATATVLDAQGHPIAADQVGFSSSDAAQQIGAVTNHGNGTYTATITSSKTAQTATITATDSSVSPSVAGHGYLAQTAPPTPPANLVAPSISGTAVVGRTLAASPGTWSGTSPIAYAYQWQRCKRSCSAIPKATGRVYKLGKADQGTHLRVLVTASNSVGIRQATSTQTAPAITAKTASQIQSQLSGLLAPSGADARIPALLKHSGYSRSMTAPAAGRLSVNWYVAGNGPHAASTLVATVTITVSANHKTKVKVALTGQGRQRLSHAARRLQLTGIGTFLLGGTGTPIRATRSLAVSR